MIGSVVSQYKILEKLGEGAEYSFGESFGHSPGISDEQIIIPKNQAT